MKEISVDNITSEYLDNANLKMKVSENFNDIILEFMVYGKVKEKYWKVIFSCKRVINFGISKEVDSDGAEEHSLLVLDTKVIKKSIDELNNIDLSACKDSDSVWQIDIYGDCNINITCIDFNWNMKSLEEEEYLESLYK
ncbi:hypothetical protein [Oceanirhabdus sp. W0125-5]|uniref:hypothetical protein n=1 Tax=Oceanirhabdus sp. W0125-5 TaxID=2999116 RepID=UPI0022F32E9D|nr:hypothetical protein [Oceanirhabdus sp. W0125-5]WBW98374.1 hypothetical protein OW730_06290 [Oceanirhabdus sp. W0125-5]